MGKYHTFNLKSYITSAHSYCLALNGLTLIMEVLVPFFGFFTSFMMIYYFTREKKNNSLLILYYLCSNVLVFSNFELYFSKSPFWEAIFFVHFIPISYLLWPLLFFYMKYSFSPMKFQKRDFFHLLPALFCFLYASPYYFLPFQEKMVLAHEIVNISFNFHLKISFFALEYILYFRSIHLLIYALCSLIYMKLKLHKNMKRYGPLSKDLKNFEYFIMLLVCLQMLIATYSHGFTSMGLSKYYLLCWGIPSHLIFTNLYFFKMMGMGFFLQNFFLFFFPSILTNRKFDVRIFSDKKIHKDTNSALPDDLNFQNYMQKMKTILDDYLVESPFIDNKFSLKKMSFELHVSEREILSYLKNRGNTNFNDWKNGLRLDYAIQLINSGQSNFLTIQGIAQTVGILSRSKFIDLFKKNMGMTPSEYIKNRIQMK